MMNSSHFSSFVSALTLAGGALRLPQFRVGGRFRAHSTSYFLAAGDGSGIRTDAEASNVGIRDGKIVEFPRNLFRQT